MCGRFAQPRSSDELARFFRARSVTSLEGERFNVAPTDPVAAVVERHGERQLDEFRWGLVPVYAADRRGAARMINARGETVEESPVYRVAFERRRCIVPADAFYEWKRGMASGIRGAVRGGNRRGKGSGLQAYAIRRRDGDPLALAGLWAVWRDPSTAQRLFTCTIVTTQANQTVAPVHDRMPVVLDPDSWDDWLAPTTPLSDVRPFLRPAPDTLLELYPVSSAVNDVRRNGPELLARVALAGDGEEPASFSLGL